MSEQNKAIARKFFDELWGKGNLNIIDELFSSDHIDHNAPPGLPPGREGLKIFAEMYLNAFPGMKISVDDMIAEGDKVVTRWSAMGKHKGELLGVPATNKDVKVTGIGIDRISGGKIVESWGEFDLAGMLQQLGVMPPMG